MFELLSFFYVHYFINNSTYLILTTTLLTTTTRPIIHHGSPLQVSFFSGHMVLNRITKHITVGKVDVERATKSVVRIYDRYSYQLSYNTNILIKKHDTSQQQIVNHCEILNDKRQSSSCRRQ